MEELGMEAAKKAAKGVLGKVKSALGVGEAEIEVSDKGIRVRAPSVEKTKELLDYGVETLLKLPQTRELLSKADKKEFEDPQVRSRKIKRSEDAQRLLKAPKVKALSKEDKLRFSTFAFIAYGDESFHSDAFSEAEKAYRRAYEFAQKLDDKPLQAICLNLIGAALSMQAEREKALVYVTEAVELKPDFAEAWYNKGMAHGKLGQPKEALACFDEALKLDPNDCQAWYGKGAALGELGQPKEALACFGEILKLDPSDCQSWYGKGMALGKLERYKEALACYDEAIRLKPDFAEAWNNKGAILCDELGEIDEAIVCFDQALELKPTLIEPWVGKGVALGELGQPEKALACYDEAIKLEPDDAEAWSNKGAVLAELGQHREALACFDKAIKLKPDDAKAWYNKGVALQRLGLESIRLGDMKGAEERALVLVKLKNEADKEGMAQVVKEAMKEFKERLSEEDLKSLKGFEEIARRFEAKRP